MNSKSSAFDEIAKTLDDNDGVTTVTMASLRDAVDVKKLGKYVVETISSELTKRGIGYHHSDKEAEYELPLNRNKCVRLYRKGTPIGRFIEAILEVHDAEYHAKNTAADTVIKEIALQTEDSEMIHKIRSIVCS